MSTFYGRAAATALRLIQDKGKTLTLSKPSTGAYSPFAGEYGTTTAGATGTAKGVILPVNEVTDNALMADLVAGKLRKIILAAEGSPFEPEAGDDIQDGSDTYEVLGCTPLKPASTHILYNLLVRMR